MTLSPPAGFFDWEDGNVTRTGIRFKESSNSLLTINFSTL